VTGPSTVKSWEKYNVSVNAPDQTDASGNARVFGSWSDGGGRQHTISTPAAAATYTATFTSAPAPPPTILTFTPVADTNARSDKPSSNYGTATTLRTDSSPDTLSYLRFDLSGVGSPVSRATLHVLATSGNRTGYDVRGVANATWGETTLTYANRPAVGSIVASSGRVTAATWTEVDVTSLVTGNGLLSVALTSTSSTATSFASRESADDPQLVVTSAGGAPPPPPPPPPPSSKLTFNPTSDAYVRSDTPGTNYGSATSVQVDGSPVKHLLLTFAVSGAAGRTASATLRLYCLDGSGAGGDFHRVLVPTSWSEGTVTWATAPAFDSAILRSLGGARGTKWMSPRWSRATAWSACV
jgi:hypothetical protein